MMQVAFLYFLGSKILAWISRISEARSSSLVNSVSVRQRAPLKRFSTSFASFFRPCMTSHAGDSGMNGKEIKSKAGATEHSIAMTCKLSVKAANVTLINSAKLFCSCVVQLVISILPSCQLNEITCSENQSYFMRFLTTLSILYVYWIFDVIDANAA